MAGSSVTGPSMPVYLGKTIRIFLSYSTEDKVLAGQIKLGLESYGLEVFLAHEDIQPSAEWIDVIMQNLRSADIFIPIITNSYFQSEWTDQEAGIAVSLDKKIIPVCVDTTPYGFIGRFQAIKLHNENLETATLSANLRIREVIIQDKKYKDAYSDCVLRAFTQSNTYDAANKLAPHVEDLIPLSKDQINFLFITSLNNSQIRDAWTAQSILKRILSNQNKLLTPKTRKLAEEVFAGSKLPSN